VHAIVAAWRTEDVVLTAGPAGAEPLCALYSVTALPGIERALSRGELSPSRMLNGALDVRRLSLEEARDAAGVGDPFLNVNTRADRAKAEELLRRTSAAGLAGSQDAYHM
jgi:molybdopterin-guanine dinucleotide biosynthesis protein A